MGQLKKMYFNENLTNSTYCANFLQDEITTQSVPKSEQGGKQLSSEPHCFDNDGDVNIISEHLTHHILVENMTCFTFFPFSNSFMGFDFDGVNHKSLPKLP